MAAKFVVALVSKLKLAVSSILLDVAAGVMATVIPVMSVNEVLPVVKVAAVTAVY